MASQTQGIQQLLAAEKRAAEKINEARKRKAQRLKQAKQEAQAEIDNYRAVWRVPGENPALWGCSCEAYCRGFYRSLYVSRLAISRELTR